MSPTIEFIGLPGAGKSTCVERVIEALRNEGVEVRDRHEARERISALHRQTPATARALQLMRHLALRPTPWARGLRLSLSMGAPHPLGLRRLYDLSRKIHNAELDPTPDAAPDAPGAPLTIFDQDIAQEIWSVLNLRELSDSDAHALDALVQSLKPYLPEMVVFLSLPPAEALRRAQQRAAAGGHRVDFGLPSPPSADDYARGHHNLEALMAALSRCGVHGLTLDASLPPEALASEALEHVRAFLSKRPRSFSSPRPSDADAMTSSLIRKLRRTSHVLYQHRGLARISDSARRLAARFPLQVDLDDFDGDLKFRLDLNEHMGSQIFWRGFYSGPQIALLRHLLEPDHVFVDIGANHGEFSVVAARQVPRGRVVAFEPNEAIHRRLRFNIESNGFENVTLSTSGLSDEPGVARIYQAAERFDDGTTHLGLATLYPTESRGQVVQEIELTTLDAFVKDAGLERVDLIKIDIEGAELSALKGADEVLTRFRPHIILELNQGTCKSAGYTMADLLDHLSGYGYTFFEIAADGQGFALKALDRQHLKPFQNIVCVRPAPAEAA